MFAGQFGFLVSYLIALAAPSRVSPVQGQQPGAGVRLPD
jgi:hypothetical protein